MRDLLCTSDASTAFRSVNPREQRRRRRSRIFRQNQDDTKSNTSAAEHEDSSTQRSQSDEATLVEQMNNLKLDSKNIETLAKQLVEKDTILQDNDECYILSTLRLIYELQPQLETKETFTNLWKNKTQEKFEEFLKKVLHRYAMEEARFLNRPPQPKDVDMGRLDLITKSIVGEYLQNTVFVHDIFIQSTLGHFLTFSNPSEGSFGATNTPSKGYESSCRREADDVIKSLIHNQKFMFVYFEWSVCDDVPRIRYHDNNLQISSHFSTSPESWEPAYEYFVRRARKYTGYKLLGGNLGILPGLAFQKNVDNRRLSIDEFGHYIGFKNKGEFFDTNQPEFNANKVISLQQKKQWEGEEYTLNDENNPAFLSDFTIVLKREDEEV